MHQWRICLQIFFSNYPHSISSYDRIYSYLPSPHSNHLCTFKECLNIPSAKIMRCWKYFYEQSKKLRKMSIRKIDFKVYRSGIMGLGKTDYGKCPLGKIIFKENGLEKMGWNHFGYLLLLLLEWGEIIMKLLIFKYEYYNISLLDIDLRELNPNFRSNFSYPPHLWVVYEAETKKMKWL